MSNNDKVNILEALVGQYRKFQSMEAKEEDVEELKAALGEIEDSEEKNKYRNFDIKVAGFFECKELISVEEREIALKIHKELQGTTVIRAISILEACIKLIKYTVI